MKNILTFDIEDWYHSNLLNVKMSQWESCENRVEKKTKEILALLDETDDQATFYVLGYVAEKYPHLVKEIHEKGHEIASHGYAHQFVYHQAPNEFRDDIKKSLDILENIIGQKIVSYRAPSWSINGEADWALEILCSKGIKYDSSMFPFKTYMYGNSKLEKFINIIKLSKLEKIVEIPPSVLEYGGIRLPFSGGFYFRALPASVINFGIKQFNKLQNPAVLYLHPWDIDNDQPKAKATIRNNFVQRFNTKSAKKKLRIILEKNSFTSIKDFFARNKLKVRHGK